MKTLIMVALKFVVILAVLVFGMMLITAYLPGSLTHSVTLFGHSIPDSMGLMAGMLLLVELVTHW